MSDSTHLSEPARAALWDAIFDYVRVCGGTPLEAAAGEGAHQAAVSKIESIVGSSSNASVPDLADVRMTSISVHAQEGEPLRAEATFQGEAIRRFAASAVGWFRAEGGENFVTADLTDPDTHERYAITMQRVGAKSPAQALAELRTALAAQSRKARVVREDPTPEQQAHARESALYALGDAILVWINEGDVYFACEDLTQTPQASHLSPPRP